jgi:hypothetical protein
MTEISVFIRVNLREKFLSHKRMQQEDGHRPSSNQREGPQQAF